MTAAELIHSRAHAELPHMGLPTWQKQEIRKSDVTIAKNYLNEDEIEKLNRIVVMWLDYAEDQAKPRKQIFMKDWEQRLDNFLEFNEREILTNAGKISKRQAEKHAQSEYDIYINNRRELKELEGETDYLKQLEGAAKYRPKK